MEDVIFPAIIGSVIGVMLVLLVAVLIDAPSRKSAPCSEFQSYRFEDVPWRCVTELPDMQ